MKTYLQILLMVFGLLAMLVCNGVVQAQIAQPITVTDADDSQPVACYVDGIQPDGKSVSLGKTDPPGKFQFTGNCERGYALLFIPENGSIYYQTSVFCEEALSKGVKLKKITMPEAEKYNAAIQKGFDSDPALTALASNVLAGKAPSEAEARGYNITMYLQFGKFLKVGKAIFYDGEKNAFVPSDDLVKATRTFQSRKGLDVSGAIDFITLKSAADPAKVDLLFQKQ